MELKFRWAGQDEGDGMKVTRLNQEDKAPNQSWPQS